MSLYCKIKKKFDDFFLDIEFDIGNETVALMGASGCGKSMTLKCISGIIKPDSGKIVLDGKVLFDSEKKINLPPQKRNVGMLFQDYALFPNMTVLENIITGIPKIRNKKSNDYSAEAKTFIKTYHLDGLENHYPYQLSGGQKQRCAIARMMASSPEIIMLDEPLSALDSFLRWKLEQEISSAIKNFGKTVLLVSHNRDEVFRLCDKVSVISNGKNDAIREKHDLYHNPHTYSDALLTGCKNIYSAEIIDGILNIPELGISYKTNNCSPNAKFASIRARYIENASTVKNSDDYVFVKYDILSITEGVFSYILMVVSTKGGGEIRWEVLKADYSDILKNPFILAIRKDEIMVLC